ncbi:hypothetical protein EON64_13240 [archaeon]|nr:MAG: hypothetical protein EON64_13240 [archaeon]
MTRWYDWRKFVYAMLGKSCPSELYAGSYDEFQGITNSAIRMSEGTTVPKLRRDSSFSSIQSGKSAEEVQRDMDMLQPTDDPLDLNEIATIVSGTMSLVDGCSTSDEEHQAKQQASRHREAKSAAAEQSKEMFLQPEMKEKKKALKDQLKKRKEAYKKVREDSARNRVLRADSMELDTAHMDSKAGWA